MPAKSKTKSIWRQPEAQHFQVVHRSQRDPLIHDADAPSRVLKPSQPRNARGGAGAGAGGPQSRSQLEAALGEEALRDQRENVGEAAEYGIYFDDTEYDYMQHLRPIGGNDNQRRGGEAVDEEDKADVVMLEAPAAKKKGAAAKDRGPITLRDEQEGSGAAGGALNLPDEVLPSKDMLPRDFGAGEAHLQTGLQPDMDPHLRQVLEALDDDAFLMNVAAGVKSSSSSATAAAAASSSAVPMEMEEEEEEEEEEEDIDDFFSGVIAGGELGSDDEAPEWRALPPGGEESIWEDSASRAARELLELKQSGRGVEELSLTSRLALFKAAGQGQGQGQEQGQDGLARGGANSDDDDDDASTSAPAPRNKRAVAPPSSVGSQSIFGEKGATRKSRHPGAKARLAASFYAPSSAGGSTAFSMSSSAMERNQGLTGLDEQFDRMERIYEQDSDEEENDDDDDDDEDGDGNGDGQPLHDLDGIFDDFLSKHEVIAGKLKARLGDRSATAAEKVDLLRRELGEVRLYDRQRGVDGDDDDEEAQADIIPRHWIEGKRQEWDVETVLTTKTNVENRPRTINAAQSVAGGSTFSRKPATLVPGAGSVRGSASSSSSRMQDGDEDVMPKVRVNPRTGQAEIVGYIKVGQRQRKREASTAAEAEPAAEESARSALSEEEDGDDQEGEVGSEDDYDSDATEGATYRTTVTRDRNESKEDKKARKAQAKEQKQSRRLEKSERKAQFAQERKRQTKIQGAKLGGGNAADVGRNGIGGGQAIHLV
ncbi:hypothetical protein FA10DRAFT_279123 [Acaromyces ingoldii]|uniref:LTV-domain-containing protein n=1 Tax=Acaromyces ingoldii TaxID=215250 RepID=A0A316YL82_9BASI|nr:hypothetical protein FA10DRAFT_279123 [Acaromyces ingoldii]PWN89806.1 hypothetical protein FA10DRAFT_279123 [Acaromyces ingoldii]